MNTSQNLASARMLQIALKNGEKSRASWYACKKSLISIPRQKVMNWDAGYYQMRPMWKEYDPDGLKKFRSIYKELGKKLRTQVYELRMLK